MRKLNIFEIGETKSRVYAQIGISILCNESQIKMEPCFEAIQFGFVCPFCNLLFIFSTVGLILDSILIIV